MTTPTTTPEQLTADNGLTAAEVQQRIEAGQTNRAPTPRGRSTLDILRANIFTVFNAILATAVVIVLLVGQWQDAVFGIVLIVNTLIGTIAEIRAKRVLADVAILDAPSARVTRGGDTYDIAAKDIVLGDLVHLSLGDQIPVDGIVRQVGGISIDESILTGESDPQKKAVGDSVMSGTSVIAGSALIQATAVGPDSYANTLGAQVKSYRKVHSELADGIDYILTRLSWVIVPLALLVMWAQLRTHGGIDGALESGRWKVAVVLGVAAVVGMIPQGLVLLTSMNFAVAGAKLARRGAIIQELPAVEVLARVDTLCLDKTGTLTTGNMAVRRIDAATPLSSEEEAALAALCCDRANATAAAIDDYLAVGRGGEMRTPEAEVSPFNSSRKYGTARIGSTLYALGAPDVLLRDDEVEAAREIAAEGLRVVAFAAGTSEHDLTSRALVVIGEELRSDASETFDYLHEQGIRLLVISGDHAATAGAVAGQVGIAGGNPRVGDARELPSEPAALVDRLEGVDVLGRVTPEQKRDIVLALKSREHVVGMTGDGVNDALALKEADLGIAMDNGARATKAVARLVLLSGKFSVLPHVLAEGRRVMANMERVSVLFLTKTMYAILLAVATSGLAFMYPFLPRHLTIIGSLSIGIPAFALAIAPNTRRYREGFLKRVLRVAVPAGIVIALAVLLVQGLAISGIFRFTIEQSQAATTLTALIIALTLLANFSQPLMRDGKPTWRAGLLASMIGIVLAIVAIPPLRRFAALELPTPAGWALILGVGVLGAAIVWRLSHRTRVRNGEDAHTIE
ncbi:cation-translocating P-type ATPase [Bowdeniella nasicola]|uniref:cation-translocating P-type ATPase n=1 Tax=Bowdeniella nasicola TaxID=208480 RepID=UPI0009F87461|nr:cation-translocating P-type ATPase [Bowdeniella nasicola]